MYGRYSTLAPAPEPEPESVMPSRASRSPASSAQWPRPYASPSGAGAAAPFDASASAVIDLSGLGAAAEPLSTGPGLSHAAAAVQPMSLPMSDLGVWLDGLGCRVYEPILARGLGVASLSDLVRSAEMVTVPKLMALGVPQAKAEKIWVANGGDRGWGAGRPAAAAPRFQRPTSAHFVRGSLESIAAAPPRTLSTLSMLQSYKAEAAQSHSWAASLEPVSPRPESETESEPDSDSETEEEETTDSDEEDADSDLTQPSAEEGIPGAGADIVTRQHVLRRDGGGLGLSIEDVEPWIDTAEGVAAAAGMRAGMRIVAVGGAEVQDAEQIRYIVSGLSPSEPIHFTTEG